MKYPTNFTYRNLLRAVSWRQHGSCYGFYFILKSLSVGDFLFDLKSRSRCVILILIWTNSRSDFSQHSFHAVSDTQKCGMGISLSGALRNLKRGRGAQWVHFRCTFSKVFNIQHINYFFTLNFSIFSPSRGTGWAVRHMGRLNTLSTWLFFLLLSRGKRLSGMVTKPGHMSWGRLSEGYMSVGAQLSSGLLSVHRPLIHGVLRNGARYDQGCCWSLTGSRIHAFDWY